jgi:hypothetical protein
MKSRMTGGGTIGRLDHNCCRSSRILYTENCIQGIKNRFAAGCSSSGGLLSCGVWFFKRFVLNKGALLL